MYIFDKGDAYVGSFDLNAESPNYGKLEFSLPFSSPFKNIYSTTDFWSSGKWYHLALIYDGSNMRIYVNGTLENAVAATGNIHSSSYPLSIGSYTLGAFACFNGTLDEVAIYDYARTEEEIMNDYCLHNVAITNVSLSRTVVGEGYIALIMATVENQGNVTETFNMTAYYDDITIFTEQWENGTQSNIFWNMGDVCRDGYIDIWDAYLISKAFGWIGPPGENPADINLDGAVNANDLSTCSKNYGKNIWTTLGIPKLIKDYAVIELPSGYCAFVGFRWNTTGVSKASHATSAYAWPVRRAGSVAEWNTTDNYRTDGIIKVSVIGDINGDFKVDVKDLVLVINHFGEHYP